MGSYGIGLERLIATVAEVLSDEKGLVWPKELAPYQLHLIDLSAGDSNVKNEAKDIYSELKERDIEVLYDDRDVRAGEKFADSDLIGIPYRAVVSGKTVAENKIEMTRRSDGKSELVAKEELLKQLCGL